MSKISKNMEMIINHIVKTERDDFIKEMYDVKCNNKDRNELKQWVNSNSLNLKSIKDERSIHSVIEEHVNLKNHIFIKCCALYTYGTSGVPFSVNTLEGQVLDYVFTSAIAYDFKEEAKSVLTDAEFEEFDEWEISGHVMIPGSIFNLIESKDSLRGNIWWATALEAFYLACGSNPKQTPVAA